MDAGTESNGTGDRRAYGDPRAAAARAWAEASRVGVYWRTRPNLLQRIMFGLVAIFAIGVLVIGAVAAVVVGVAVVALVSLIRIVQGVIDRLRGVQRGGPGGTDSGLRRNVRVMGPRE
jgi:hypothetical protein